jgi:hypothetical protein
MLFLTYKKPAKARGVVVNQHMIIDHEITKRYRPPPRCSAMHRRQISSPALGHQVKQGACSFHKYLRLYKLVVYMAKEHFEDLVANGGRYRYEIKQTTLDSR